MFYYVSPIVLSKHHILLFIPLRFLTHDPSFSLFLIQELFNLSLT